MELIPSSVNCEKNEHVDMVKGPFWMLTVLVFLCDDCIDLSVC